MKKIAIFGGTFNPVHKEHVNVSVNAVKELNLDKLIIMPTNIPPHKSDIPAPSKDRLKMLELAFKDCEKVEISDYEIKKQGKSFTYQTVEHFSCICDCQLYFIVGGDMLKDFRTWKNPAQILSNCTLVAFNRENSGVDFASEQEYFKKTFGKEFIKLNYVGKDCSSTEIRTYNSFGLDIKDKTDERVAEYIKKENLYSGDNYTEFVKKTLPEKRLIHTANVVTCALQKAKENNLDKEKVRISATLHDVAKYMDYKQVKDFVLPEGVPQPVIHAFLGAYIAEKILKIQDQEIIDAIRYHTSGKENMSQLAKLIFVADMVEKGRVYDGVEKLRQYYQKASLDECFKQCLKEEVIHLINKGQYIYSQTLQAFDYYNKK